MSVYNEVEPYPAQWLRNLIAADQIARGAVLERSIVDVTADDVRDRQAHFFAGIGLWSLAFRLAGIPDDFPAWSGSAPCQPFSQAGARGGADDERHLWPEWFSLISECRPPIIFGEQVASVDGLGWLDVVCSDLEGAGYAVAAADLCAASIGAPHIRQRLYFVAYASGSRTWRLPERQRRREQAAAYAHRYGTAHELANASGERRERDTREERSSRGGNEHDGALGDASGDRDREHVGELSGDETEHAKWCSHHGNAPVDSGSSSLGSFWGNAEWRACSDGVSRPIEPGIEPLGNGYPARMAQLSAYGNAIVPQLAAAFISAALDAIEEG